MTSSSAQSTDAVSANVSRETVPLGKVAKIVSGFGFPKELQGKTEGDLPFFKVGDISAAWKSGRQTLTTAQHYLSEEEARSIKARAFPKGTIVFAKIGEAIKLNRRAILGRPALVDNNVMGLIPEYEVVDHRYLFYWTLTQKLGDISQATTVPSIRKSDVEALEFPLVQIDQQKHIVAEIEKQFSRLDEAVANLKRVKANLKRYKAAVLKAAVEGRLVETEAEVARCEGRSYETGAQLLQRILETRRSQWKGKGKYKEPAAPDTTDLPELPEGWVWTNVDELAVVVRGASPRPAGDPKYFGGPIPWITVGPITAAEGAYLRAVPDSVTELGKDNSRYIEPGTLLLTNSGATLGVPKITLIGGCINDGVAALLEVGDPLKMYLLHHLSSLTESLRRINQGAAQPNLNTSIIRAILIPLPPSSEQGRIVTEIDRRLSLVREVESQIEANSLRSDRLRQSILADAFSGRLLLKVTQERAQYVQSVAKGR